MKPNSMLAALAVTGLAACSAEHPTETSTPTMSRSTPRSRSGTR